MSQPKWKCIANLGDADPITYDGYFVFVDETNVYEAKAEYLISPEEDEGGKWEIYRFSLDRCTFNSASGVLSDNKFHPEHPAWFAKPEKEKENRPQDTTYLSRVANCSGIGLDTLREMFRSADPKERAWAYRFVGECHGFDNLDRYPLSLTTQEIEERYGQILPELKGK